MSDYKNFIQDFPRRCLDILTKFESKAKEQDREITLMLVVASASLIIPYERLGDFKNPSGDAKKYPQAKSKFANECGNKTFLNWVSDGKSKNWKFKELDKNIIKQQPEKWIENIQCLPTDMKVVCVLSHLRNAFAHGTIFTSPNLDNNETQIQSLLFLCERRHNNSVEGYNLIMVSPEDFHNFLEKWVEFLAKFDVTNP